MDQESKKKPEQAKLKIVTCGHCGRKQRVRMPSTPGKYRFQCPNCEHKVAFEVGGEHKVLNSDILDDRVISRRMPGKQEPARDHQQPHVANRPNVATLPVLGIPKPIAGKEKQYYVVEKAQVNKQYCMQCPGCGKTIRVSQREAGKRVTVTCSICGSKISFSTVGEQPAPATPAQRQSSGPPPLHNALALSQRQEGNAASPQQAQDDGPETVLLNPPGYGGTGLRQQGGQGAIGGRKTPPPLPSQDGDQLITWRDPEGMLLWKSRKHFMKTSKSYRLLRGRNIVGRSDPDKPSDVMIDGDDEMSRQSVEIKVERSPVYRDYTYELRVIHATNPVRVNGRSVGYGTTVSLNYGDTICMGRTNISFVKVNDDKK